MDTKLKAEELINYFITLRPPKLSDYTQIYQPSAKLCALKVCEEVLSYTDREKEFWEEVKEEIEKL